jgi:hypothetical protein
LFAVFVIRGTFQDLVLVGEMPRVPMQKPFAA